MNIGYVWVLANYPGDAGAVDLDTPAKMLDRLFSEVINDVVNMDENKTHILNVLTLSKWEESEVRCQIATLLKPLTEDKNHYLQFMGRYLNVYQEKPGEEVINNPNSLDFIFGRWNGVSNSFESANFPIGYEGGNSGVCPSHNLVEAFDMRDGTPFDWNNPEHRNKALEPSERDPRLAQTVLMNGQTFKDKVVESFIGGMNGLPKEGASPTSYYLRKHLKEATDLTTGSATSYQHIWPLFRYAEVLLNYAEALLEATKEPDFKGTLDNVQYTVSPREAVNMIRTRVDMNAVETTGYDAFKKRLRNERRVELAFEGHRFWDIRRWMTGTSTTRIEGLSITAVKDESGEGYIYSYEKKTVQERIWEERMNYYPIQDVELFKNHNLVQNEGWESN